jgi:hypothetical protein
MNNFQTYQPGGRGISAGDLNRRGEVLTRLDNHSITTGGGIGGSTGQYGSVIDYPGERQDFQHDLKVLIRGADSIMIYAGVLFVGEIIYTHDMEQTQMRIQTATNTTGYLGSIEVTQVNNEDANDSIVFTREEEMEDVVLLVAEIDITTGKYYFNYINQSSLQFNGLLFTFPFEYNTIIPVATINFNKNSNVPVRIIQHYLGTSTITEIFYPPWWPIIRYINEDTARLKITPGHIGQFFEDPVKINGIAINEPDAFFTISVEEDKNGIIYAEVDGNTYNSELFLGEQLPEQNFEEEKYYIVTHFYYIKDKKLFVSPLFQGTITFSVCGQELFY